jgi:RHS repeat-associated protein
MGFPPDLHGTPDRTHHGQLDATPNTKRPEERSTKMHQKILLFLLLYFTLASVAYAQVDLAMGSTSYPNDNIHQNIPIFSKPGFDLHLDFDSHLVIAPNLNGTHGNQFVPYVGIGPDAGIEASITAQSAVTVNSGCNSLPQTTYSLAVLILNGQAHPMSGSFTWKTGSGSGCNTTPPSGLTTTDDSHITVITTSTPWVAYTKDGTSFTLLSSAYATPSPLYKRTDTNGNTTTLSASGGVYTYTDIYGVGVVTFKVNQGAGGTPGDVYSYVDGSGTTRHVTVNYTQYAMGSDFGCSGVGEVTALAGGVSSPYLPTSVVMPDGSEYQFSYEEVEVSFQDYKSTGRVYNVYSPGGLYLSYSYNTPSGGIHAIDCNSAVVPQLEMSIYDGINTSSITAVNNLDSPANNNFTVTVTNSVDNTVATTYYSGANVNLQQQYSGNPALFPTEEVVAQGSTQLSNKFLCYNNLLSPPTACVAPTTSPIYPITQIDTYSNHDGMATSLTNHVKTTFDGNENVTSSTVYDWGTWGGSLLSSTVTAYGSGSSCASIGSYIVNKPCTVQVTNGGSTVYRSAVFTYNSHGNLTASSKAMSSGVNQTFSFARNTNGSLSSVTNTSQTPNYTIAAYTYGNGSCNGFMPTKIDYSGAVSTAGNTQATWDCNGGVPVTVTDQNGNVTKLGYNDFYYRPTSVTHPDSSSDVDSITYNGGANFPWSVVTVNPLTASNAITTTETLNGRGEPTQITATDPNNTNSGLKYQDLTYNGLGQLIEKSNPYFSKTEGTYGNYQYTYDALGRIVYLSTPADAITTTFTGRDTRVYDTIVGGNINEYTEKDGGGRIKYTCDGIGAGTQANGDTTTPCGLADVSVSGFQNYFVYNPAGDLTYEQRTGSAHSEAKSYSVDLAGRMTGRLLPEETTQETWVYDSPLVGQLHTYTDARNITTTYYVDNLFRTTGVTFSDGVTPSYNYWYDVNQSGQGITGTNLVGRLVMANGSNETNNYFSYDVMGRVVNHYEAGPLEWGVSWSQLGYTYDFAGNLTSLADADAQNTLTYGRNSIGELTYIQPSYTGSGGDVVPPYIFGTGATPTYNAFGEITSFNDADSLSHVISYDSMGRVTANVAKDGVSPIYSYNLTYDPDNNVISNQGVEAGGEWQYQYDALNRLQEANCPDVCVTGMPWELQWTYDEFGNRWTQSVLAGSGPQPSYSFDTHNHQTGGVTYDAAGNMTYDGNNTYTFDALNRLTSISGSASLNYVFDALGNRVETSGTGLQTIDFVFSGSQPIHDNSSTFTGKNMEVEPFGQYGGTPGSGAMDFWVHFRNQVGSMGRESKYNVSGYDGSSDISWMSDPFGDDLTKVGTGSTTITDLFLFGDMFRDTSWGSTTINHTPARENTTIQGRWLSVDPAHSGWNGYVYADNNPVTESDPSGLCGKGPQATSAPCSDSDLIDGPDGPASRGHYLDKAASQSDDFAEALAESHNPNYGKGGMIHLSIRDSSGPAGGGLGPNATEMLASEQDATGKLVAQNNLVAQLQEPDLEREEEAARPEAEAERALEPVEPEKPEPNVFNWMHPGPLPNDIAKTFSGGRYVKVEVGQEGWSMEDARVYGGKAGPEGRDGTFYSPTPQKGGLQSQIDLALRPEWGNTATNTAAVYLKPGTIVYVGNAASQGGIWVGGTIQIYVPK